MTQEARLVASAPREGLRNRMLALRGLGIFDGVDDDGLSLAAEYGRIVSLPKGTTITTAGSALRSIHIVLEGHVTVTRGEGRVVAIGPGRAVGWLEALAHDTEAPLAVADVDTRAIEVPTDAFLSATEENFSLLRNALRHCAAGLLHTRKNLPARPDKPPPVTMGKWSERPLTFIEVLLDLADGTGPLARANIDALVDVARSLREVRVPPGHLFWRAGEPAKYGLRIIYGTVRCTNPEGAYVDIGADWILGTMDAWAAQPHVYEARTRTEVIGYQTDFVDFLALLEAHPEMAIELLSNLARDLLENG